VTLHQPDVIFLQETLADERTATQALLSLFPGWDFLGLDAHGRLGGLVIGWLSRKINLLNSWASDSCLGLEVQTEGLGMTLKLLNIYGPNTKDTLLEHPLKKRTIEVRKRNY
jgi:hypothetical protein